MWQRCRDSLGRAAGVALESAQISVLEAGVRLDRQEVRWRTALVARRSADLRWQYSSRFSLLAGFDRLAAFDQFVDFLLVLRAPRFGQFLDGLRFDFHGRGDSAGGY